MGLFDRLKKKKEEPEQPAEEVCTAGWDAIEQEFLRVYPGQDKLKHYGTIIKWILGGNDPLDGISVYDGGDYWHFVSFGLTEIYDKETDDPAVSGYGYELTVIGDTSMAPLTLYSKKFKSVDELKEAAGKK